MRDSQTKMLSLFVILYELLASTRKTIARRSEAGEFFTNIRICEYYV